MEVNRALISVWDKTGMVEFARELQGLGIDIVSTGGTASVLKEKGIEVKEASEITDFPEILNGRVKTLHPKIHGGILARRRRKSNIQEMEKLGIGTIDLVVVDLYPFGDVVESGSSIDEAVENIDIGGPALIRSAAKNYRDVAIVTKPDQYGRILNELKRNDRKLKEETRKELAKEAFIRVTEYDKKISRFFKEKFE